MVSIYCKSISATFKSCAFETIKFGAVGGTGALLGLGVMWGLVEFLGLFYLLANCFAFCISTSSNYLLNGLWTFERTRTYRFGYGRYFGLSLVTLGLNTGLLWIMTSELGLWYMASAILAILLVFPVNFIISRRFIWTKRKY